MQFLMDNWTVIAPCLWVVANEILAHSPSLAANSMIQLVMGLFKSKLPPSTTAK